MRILHDAFYEGMQTPGFLEICQDFHVARLHRDPQEFKKYIEHVYTRSGKILEKFKKK